MNRANEASPLSIWCDRAIILWLFVFALFAPHSIAVTQGAWLCGGLLWVIRFFVFPPPKTYRTPVDYALLGFFILTGLSAVLSYEPMVSIGKLRAASLFTIVYLFAENIPSRRVVRLLAVTLVASCMINVIYTAAERAVGRGVKVQAVRSDSPLAAGVWIWQRRPMPFPVVSGDTVLAVDGQPVRSPDQLALALAAASGRPTAEVTIYRTEFIPTLKIPRGRLLAGATAEEQLGIAGWSRGRDWRAAGFYGHYVTYAETLQLITSLALGLFICVPVKRSRAGLLLLLALGGFTFALLLTVTRASWLALLASAGLMLVLGVSRRTLLIVAACLIPVILAGLFVLQQKRNVRFFDQKDASTTWRETVWHEGFELLKSKPRHLLVGVGMDSIKAHWRQWGLFDNGRLPMGHMHSNLLQLALERGVPALIAWLLLLGIYARTLWRSFRQLKPGASIAAEGNDVAAAGKPEKEATEMNASALGAWVDRGIVLGALGGLAGFFTSGLVHYNWGDSEVVMIFYFIMGLSLVVHREVNSRIVGT
jgi:hypothetical protein